MTAKEQMSRNDWETLQFAPLWAARIVMGKAEPSMLMSLTKNLLDYATSGEGRLTQEVCMSIVEGHQDIIPRFVADSRDPIRGLMAVKNILDQLSPEEALKFKLAINGFAQKMLDASHGGGFLQRRKERSEKERRIGLVSATLGLRGAGLGGALVRLYLLFPQQYAKDLEPDKAVGSIQDLYTEEFGREAHVIGWQVWDRPVPSVLVPEMIMSVIKSAAEKGIDASALGQKVTYATVECPPGTMVGVCVFSDQPIKKRR